MMRARVVLLTMLLAGAQSLAAQGGSRGALIARLDSIVTAQMVANKNVGVSVGISQGGDVILAKGYGYADLEHRVPASAETVYRIGSITKQFTALGIMQLVEQGKLSLDDELTTFLPGYPVQGNRVTIHHLLTHSSGIKSYTSLGPKFWTEASRMDLDDEQMLRLFAEEPFDFAPGERYAYNNSGYYLLGVIIAKVTGVPYSEYLEHRILGPLGLRATLYCDNDRIVPHRAEGYEIREGTVTNDGLISMNTPGAAGAMCSTVLDLLAWQRAFNRAALISPAGRDKMRAPHVAAGGSGHYGYGLRTSSVDGHPLVAHSGGINGFNSHLVHLADADLTVAVLTNNGAGRAPELAAMLVRAILAAGPEAL